MCDLNPLSGKDLLDGKLDVEAIASKAVKGYKNSTSPLAVPDQQAAAYSKIPGLRMDMIPPDAPVASVLGDAKGLPDVSGPSWAIGGKEMIARIKRNPAIYAVGQWWNNARKRAELYETTKLAPLSEKLGNMLNKDIEGASTLMGVFKAEMFAGARLTADELSSSGLTPNKWSYTPRLEPNMTSL